MEQRISFVSEKAVLATAGLPPIFPSELNLPTQATGYIHLFTTNRDSTCIVSTGKRETNLKNVCILRTSLFKRQREPRRKGKYLVPYFILGFWQLGLHM